MSKADQFTTLGINNYNRFINNYKNQNRGVVEHKIQISNYKKDDFIRLLFENSKQENKFYIYDYFNDNCSTKVASIYLLKILMMSFTILRLT